MKELFKDYLTKQGYSVTTPTGNPSTVYGYAKRIDKVCKWGNFTWMGLAENIGEIVEQYDVGGGKEDLGLKSKSAVSNALKRFQEFLAAQV